jgi:RNase H-like domain found in reverse transcriptase
VEHLRAVFRILLDNGIAINLDKCEFAVAELNFLCHHLSAASVTPLQDSLQVMFDFPRSHTVKDLQRFLGMVNFHRRFLPKIAETLAPLTNLLKGKDLPKLHTWEECHDAAKVVLAAAVLLAHLLPDVPLALATNASDTHVGGVLQQKMRGHWQPGFFSCRLSATEANYSTFDRKLLVAQVAINHFFPQVESWQLSLVDAMSRVPLPASGRQQQAGSSGTWPSLPSTRPACSTPLVWTTWWPMLCGGPRPPPPAPPSPH